MYFTVTAGTLVVSLFIYANNPTLFTRCHCSRIHLEPDVRRHLGPVYTAPWCWKSGRDIPSDRGNGGAGLEEWGDVAERRPTQSCWDWRLYLDTAGSEVRQFGGVSVGGRCTVWWCQCRWQMHVNELCRWCSNVLTVERNGSGVELRTLDYENPGSKPQVHSAV